MTVNEICEYLSQENGYILTSHEAPDGDAIGSEIVLYSILNYLKKDVVILNSDITEHKYRYMDQNDVIHCIAPGDEMTQDLSQKILIVVDTEPDNIGHLSALMNKETVRDILVIDHHDYKDKIPFKGLYDPNASSTCEILYEIQQHLKVPYFDPLTEAMFTGIVYDTGSFIYPKTTAKTFSIAYNLVSNGARPNFVYSNLYESKSTESLKLRTMVGSSLTLYFNNHVAYQYMDMETLIKSGAKYEESQEIVNIPLQCNDVRVSIFIKENSDGKARCSIRTKNEIDCLPIVSRFHGGGHPTAAGFKLNKPVEEVRHEVLEFFAPFFT
ncbi:bifunctional oligoribonuclease/PAP phosphatase NrnA [Oceanispirochaeta crateris]|uniref:Bifunctional oligoribonuclease/PAP phosphatase NrnA n=1 Tax=Oceanispirochaeta crateris TaxID=2518645 RepID=A0A5C1QMA9_9SPIO|nr:bifunctional oligoribonuclease/PAP phosphatase NrnA [Oceanispirochaeta crateris]QEN07684.1 bifunctional oligoribonuclease/PAP phosphatase NrnA [Oceanispirochaeta crateris]